MNTGGVPRRTSLTEHVRWSIQERITAQSLKPGDRLPTERALIEEFGVSRTVVRDAIARLRAEGLVDSRQGAGVFVRAPSLTVLRPDPRATLSAIIENIEVRLAIEVEAVRLAIERASPAQMSEIDERWKEMADPADIEESERADLAFHLAIVKATNNARFPEMFNALGAHTIPRARLRYLYQTIVETPFYAERLIAEHGAIRAAIVERDAERASQAMRTHLLNSRDNYVKLMRDAKL